MMSSTEMSDVQNNSSVWKAYGKEEYDNVEGSSAKRALDTKIAAKIYQELQYSDYPSIVGEFGCGPAPVSKKLLEFNEGWGEKLFDIIGFDNSQEMSQNTPKNENFTFQTFDLANPYSAEEYLKSSGKKLDAAILENSWYAVTTGVGEDTDESLYRRLTALQNVWTLLKNNGILIITDPNLSTKELNLKHTLQGLEKEVSAAIKRGEVEKSIKNITDPRTKETIARNRNEILPTSQLFTHTEMVEFIINSGLFEINKAENSDYIGHNSTIILEKINEPELQVNGTFILKILDSKARPLLEDFRRKNYSEKVNPIVTGVDEQDYKHKESYTAVSTLKGTNIPGAIATFDLEDDYKVDSWEFAELFNLSEDIIETILPDNRRTAEIRRLGTVGAYAKDYTRLGLESTLSVFKRMYEEARRRDVGIMFFTATPDRLKLFNAYLRKLKLPDFEEVPNVKLNRDDESNLKTFLTGGKYFFNDKGWANLATNENLLTLRDYLITYKDKSLKEAVKDLWPQENTTKLTEITEMLKNEEQFPSNASLYYAPVQQEDK
jgi:SAM-dependent methyltransferase